MRPRTFELPNIDRVLLFVITDNIRRPLFIPRNNYLNKHGELNLVPCRVVLSTASIYLLI